MFDTTHVGMINSEEVWNRILANLESYIFAGSQAPNGLGGKLGSS